MNRTPPKPVLDELRAEVGFGCPVTEPDGLRCGNPYLTWHHFDPPWAVRQHHEPTGMVALCQDHHSKADAGTYTIDQLREMKSGAIHDAITRRFDWLRRDALLACGGMFMYARQLDAFVPLQIGVYVPVGLSRDPDGYWRLNLDMRSSVGEPRLRMVENTWTLFDPPEEFECPPSGRVVRALYGDGDYLRVEFKLVEDAVSLLARYSWSTALPMAASELCFPLLVVEVVIRFDGGRFELTPKLAKIGGSTVRDCLAEDTKCIFGTYARHPWQRHGSDPGSSTPPSRRPNRAARRAAQRKR